MRLHGKSWLTRVCARAPVPTRPDPEEHFGSVDHQTKPTVTREPHLGLESA